MFCLFFILDLLNEALKQYFIGFNYKSNIDQLWLQTGAAKILRKSGQKQRLHQLVLRYIGFTFCKMVDFN